MLFHLENMPPSSCTFPDRRPRLLVQLCETLKDMRTTSEDLAFLPAIAVCGNQSAGKSSLLEAISQLQLPRDDGTCTRGPIEIRMRTHKCTEKASADGFACCIKTGPAEYGLPTEHLIEYQHPTIYNREEVENGIRAAQETLLSAAGCNFTYNSVIVEVHGGPEDLSLVDLPGIIATTAEGPASNEPEMINTMVQAYLNQPNTLIVACFTCKEDMNMQVCMY
jgi:GTPase SAR1 family protein